MSKQLDAVVLGSGLNALGILRSLAPAGIRVAVVYHGAAGPASRSRYACKKLALPAKEFTPDAIAVRLGLDGQKPVLFLTEELDVFSCVADVTGWNARYETYFFTPEIAADLLNKSLFERHASEVGSLIPKTTVVAEPSDLSRIEGFRWPLVVKPAYRDNKYSERFDKAYKVPTEAALKTLVNEVLTSRLEIVLQEWIDGDDSDIYFNIVFVDQVGALRTSFVGRKVLCWPPQVGGTASCVAAPEFHEQLTGYTMSFLKGVGFTGLVGIEYKRDRRDGKFYMIEPTVYRTDYQHEIATLCGTNILLDAFRSIRGDDSPSVTGYANPSYWVDFPAARYSEQSSAFDRSILRGKRTVDAYFRWVDPVPGLIHYWHFLCAALRNVVRRGLSR